MGKKRLREPVLLECKHHGLTEFFLYDSGQVCIKCKTARQTNRQRENKARAVQYKGGKCAMCGLETEHLAVYDFHHTDPAEKEANIAELVFSASWVNIKAELDKCIMLCSNCHRIVHSQEAI